MDNGTSTVYFTGPGAGKTSLLKQVSVLLERLGIDRADLSQRLTAIKIHFGEKGNTSYVRPVFAAQVVEDLKRRGARPFLTDTNTLYIGSRADAVSHFQTAMGNGFDYASVGAPVIIAGGLLSTEGRMVAVAGQHFRDVEIAPEILDADFLVGLTHFKGHEMSGFGGTLKNFGMGAATRRGKLAMHSTSKPTVQAESCIGCARCLRWCAFKALSLNNKKAAIDASRCSGCGACLAVCPEGAIHFAWDGAVADMQEKMVEHAWGALQGHLPDRAFFLNIITQVSPLCDCYPFADAPVVPDVGIVASLDPVAIDQASVDLVNHQPGLAGSALPASAQAPGTDKFRAIHPRVDWEIQLRHAEQLGLGRRRYELVTL